MHARTCASAYFVLNVVFILFLCVLIHSCCLPLCVVALFPFDAHNAPPYELIEPFCDDVDAWLTKNPENVAVVHGKGGKLRD